MKQDYAVETTHSSTFFYFIPAYYRIFTFYLALIVKDVIVFSLRFNRTLNVYLFEI